MSGEQAQYMTPQEVAALLLVSPITVRQWAQKGLLRAQTTAGGHRRFAREDIERFAKERGIVIPGVDKSVLVVDDDPQLNSYLVALFKTSFDDLNVLSAKNGFEAGRLVARFKPDIVVLDIMMPGMDGVAVCQAIKADDSTASSLVVAMTGHHTQELEHRVLQAGAAVLLKKPFTPDELFGHCALT